MASEPDKTYFDYNEITQLCHELSAELKDIHTIVCVARGGAIPGVILSYMIPHKKFDVIVWQTRDGGTKEFKQEIVDDAKHGKVLFIDDINDSGRTFREIFERYEIPRDRVVFASLVQRYSTQFPSDHSVIEFTDDSWAVFPWEN